MLLANTAGRQMAGIVGIADIINIGGVGELLIVNAINGFLIIATATAYSVIVDRVQRIRLLQWTAVGFLVAFGVLGLLQLLSAPPRLTAALLYITSQQQWLIFPMVFW